MPKKTLNEATVRQFMKLVNHKPDTISNFISENYNEEKVEEGAYAEGEGHSEEKMEEGVYEEEEAVAEMAPAMEAEEDEDADPVDDMPPAPPMDDEPAGMKGEVDITPEMADVLIELGDMLKDAMGDEAAPMPDADGPEGMDDKPEEPMMEEEEVNEAAEEPAKEAMDEQEMVQEVARRVAARILKAKKAKQNK